MKAVRVRVTGKVQGVSFRAYAAREAVRVEVAGWVANEPDGSVALHVEGEDDAVDEMVRWCHQGSPGAGVERVDVEPAEAQDPGTFEVRY